MYLVIYVNEQRFTPIVEKYSERENYSEYNLKAQDEETIRLANFLKMDTDYWQSRDYREASIQVQKIETGFWWWKKVEEIYTFNYSACGSVDFSSDLHYLESEESINL